MTDAADPITEQLCAELKASASRGLQKYGVTLDAAQLTPGDLLQHAKEEALDLAAYLQKLISMLESQADRIANAPKAWAAKWPNRPIYPEDVYHNQERAERAAVGSMAFVAPIALVELTEEEAQE